MERIDRYFLDDEDGTTQFINIPKAKIYGTEVSANYLFDIFESSLSYTSMRGRDLTNHRFLWDLPADVYAFTQKAYFDKYDFVIGYSISHTLEQNRINPEMVEQRTRKTGSYSLQDIFMLKRFKKNFEVSLKIDNLGNKEYRKHASHLYEVKENIKFGFKYKVNTY